MFPYLWLNGRIVSGEEAKVPALSLGFLYGLGLFETMRWYAGRGVFGEYQHRRRMEQGFKRLGLAVEDPWDGFQEALVETLRANRVREDVVVRWTVAVGPDPGDRVRMLHLRPVPYQARDYREGVEAATVVLRRGSLAEVKALCYADLWGAARFVRERGAQEALVCEEDFLLEGSTTNLFLVSGGRLLTPPLDGRILPGIARATVLGLAEELGLRVQETPLRRSELKRAEEAFLTNSVAEVLPLVRVDGEAVGDGRPGVWTRRLHRAYRELVRCALGENRCGTS
ncbi:MAG: branched chain amino acid--2-keto-4-methylthiobutyrate aminotransferase [Candidatus Poribacteria bacterium]|nr:MAG: branched chain amino acid--2-keto-4-methylthiobutyrate aminotransferase [Candidatus Poribacteria bacterium]